MGPGVRIPNQDISVVVCLQSITVIRIQRDDGYFAPIIKVWLTFEVFYTKTCVITAFKSLDYICVMCKIVAKSGVL